MKRTAKAKHTSKTIKAREIVTDLNRGTTISKDELLEQLDHSIQINGCGLITVDQTPDLYTYCSFDREYAAEEDGDDIRLEPEQVLNLRTQITEA